MPNEYALIGLVDFAALSRDHGRHAGSGAPCRGDAHTRAHRPRARVLRVITRRAVMRTVRLLRQWRRCFAESAELRSMSDRDLRDFGTNRYEAAHEASQAFWRQRRWNQPGEPADRTKPSAP